MSFKVNTQDAKRSVFSRAAAHFIHGSEFQARECISRSVSFISLLCSQSKAYAQVFAYGEDSLSLRLTSKLVDLRSGNANWISRFARKPRSNNDISSRHPRLRRTEALRKSSMKTYFYFFSFFHYVNPPLPHLD